MKRDLKLHKRTFCSANILTVEAGTNTPQGGDAGHGGRTVLRIDGHRGSTVMMVEVDGRKFYGASEVTIELGGDTEAITFISALLFAASVLQMQNSRIPYPEEN